MIEFKFEPLEEFKWLKDHEDGSRSLVGHYHPKATYNCSSDPIHDELRIKCDEWLSVGKIKIYPLAQGAAFKAMRG